MISRAEIEAFRAERLEEFEGAEVYGPKLRRKKHRAESVAGTESGKGRVAGLVVSSRSQFSMLVEA